MAALAAYAPDPCLCWLGKPALLESAGVRHKVQDIDLQPGMSADIELQM